MLTAVRKGRFIALYAYNEKIKDKESMQVPQDK